MFEVIMTVHVKPCPLVYLWCLCAIINAIYCFCFVDNYRDVDETPLSKSCMRDSSVPLIF